MLKVDWIDRKTADYATEKWHYSKSSPVAKRIQMGAWENGEFIGAVIYALGANKNAGNEFNLSMFEICELCRVALAPFHQSPVTQILAITRKMLKQHAPLTQLIVSYADIDQNHHGGIYQADNWIYIGATQQGNAQSAHFRINGSFVHRRTVSSRYGSGSIEWIRENIDPNAELIYSKGKHKYIYPLNKSIRKAILNLAKKYPAAAVSRDMPSDQLGEGGSIPTQPLNLSETDK